MKKFAAILIVLALAGTVQANMILNGTFDSDISGWGDPAAYDGVVAWTSSGEVGGGIEIGAGTAGALAVYHVPGYTAATGDVLTLTASAADGGTAGGSLNPVYVHIWGWNSATPPSGPADISALTGLATGALSWTAAALNAGWSTETTDITIDAANDGQSIVVGFTQWPGYAVHGDNFILTPEPVTLAILGIGAVLVVMRRRR